MAYVNNTLFPPARCSLLHFFTVKLRIVTSNKFASLKAQMIVKRKRPRSQLFGILTDVQKAKAAEMKNKLEARFRTRFEKILGDKRSGNKQNFQTILARHISSARAF
jgi:hypothetical protein